jgi:DnaJ-class molecular chaperone
VNNLYEVLGVATNASADDIKKSYRKLAMEHHPDRGGDEEKFKKITEAYSVLSDDQQRREYDFRRANPQPHHQQHQGHVNISDIFESMFNQRRGHQQYRQPPKKEQPQETLDRDIKFKLGATLDQIKNGATQKINFQRNEKCAGCDGTGGEERSECGICQGTGVETERDRQYIRQFACRMCQSRGIVFSNICQSCQGAGVRQVLDTVTVKIKKV